MLATIQHHIHQFGINQWGIKIDNLKHVLTTVYQDFQKITSNDVINSNEAAKAMYEVCQSLIKNDICKNFTNGNIEDHQFFLLFKNTIQFIFEKASSENGTVGEREWKIYKALYVLLKELAPQKHDKKLNKIIENILFNDKFLATFKQCIEKVLARSAFTSCELLNDVLHHFYANCQYTTNLTQPHLLHLIIRCILSSLYLENFNNPTDSSSRFFLQTCPLYIVSNAERCTDEIVNLLCPSLINYFDKIILYKSSSGFIQYLNMLNLCATIESGRSQFTEHIIENLFEILNWGTEVKTEKIPDPDDSRNELIVPVLVTKDKSLIVVILALLYNLTVNSVMLSIIKRLNIKLIDKWNPDQIQSQDIDKLSLLCDIKDDDICFPAQNLLALCLENIDRLPQPQQLTASYIVYFSKTINGTSQIHNGLPLSSLMGNMKNVAHNRRVKEQLVTKKGLPLLTKAACHEKFDTETIQQPALDIIWTVSFNRKAAELWKNDEKFVKQLKLLLNSNVKELEMVADGILWRLENEAQFRTNKLKEAGVFTQINEKETDIDQDYTSYYVRVETNGVRCVRIRKNLTDDEQAQLEEKRIEEGKAERKKDSPYRYDLMISYCSDNKELCHLIYECLTKTKKYNVWIDKEKMHGSLMERMAEAIEESEYVLVCMSGDYSKSQACQSEAEYAYRSKHRLIFIKVETKYTPNSWLGFLLGNNYYVDFTKADFASAFKDLYTQIHRHRKIENVDYSILSSIITPSLIDNAATIVKKNAEKKGLVAPKKSTSNDVPTSSESTEIVPTPAVINNTLENIIPPRSNSPSITKTSVIDISDEKSTVLNVFPSTTESIDRPDIRDEDFDSAEFFDKNIDIDELYPDDFDFDYDTDESPDYDPDLYAMSERNHPQKTSLASSRFSWSSISSESAEEVETDPETKPNVTNVRTKDQSHPQSTSVASSSVNWYENKPLDDWTQQEVFRFLNEKNLTCILTLFENNVIVNGKSLHQLYSMLMPKSEEEFEILKKRINSLPTTKLSAADYKRFHQEMEKIVLPFNNHESVVCSIM